MFVRILDSISFEAILHSRFLKLLATSFKAFSPEMDAIAWATREGSCEK